MQTPWRFAVTASKGDLSGEQRKQIQKLSHPDPFGYLLQLSLTWAQIVTVVFLATRINHILFSAAAIFFIATRQNLLGLLMHEQTHHLGLNGKVGDTLTNIFCCYPLLITLQDYQAIHLNHHRHFFTEQDPDYMRKVGAAWVLPMTTRTLVKLVLRDLTGLSLMETIKGKMAHRAQKIPVEKGIRVSFYFILGIVLTLTQSWEIFLFYWILPLVTFLQLLVRWGALCEHRYNGHSSTVKDVTPVIRPSGFERFCIPYLNFHTYHVLHHYFPTVPVSKLGQIHSLFIKDGLIHSNQIYHSYWHFFKACVRGK